MSRDINQTVTTNYSDVAANTFDSFAYDGVSSAKETVWQNDRWLTDWTSFNRIPKLKSAILMKSTWTVGKGYEADIRTKAILDHITGNGKESFIDILFNLVVCKQVGGDAFAEIIRDDLDQLINLKVLDPGSMRIVYDEHGIIKRYEQLKANPTAGVINKFKNVFRGKNTVFEEFKPDQIFHLSHDNLAGQIHGISVPQSVEQIILADDENFKIMKKLTRFQAVPFIIFKVKTDNAGTIANFKANIKSARENGEDLIIPDDDNLLTWETVQLNPSALLMEWRTSLNNEFYRAVGMPLILFGSAGTTESGGKIEYLGHETVFEHDQRHIEEQIEQQLGLKINLVSPTSLLENLQRDENKDVQNALSFQQNDVQAGSGA